MPTENLQRRTHKPPVILLSPDSYVAKAICHDYHEENHGSGATFIIGKMLGNREEPTNVVRARIILEKLSNRCIKCRIYRGQVGRAQMGDIPAAKFFFEGAFSHIQIDNSGAFLLYPSREAPKRIKYSILIVVCKSSGLCHFELMEGGTGHETINALKRVEAIYGRLLSVTSDPEVNFVAIQDSELTYMLAKNLDARRDHINHQFNVFSKEAGKDGWPVVTSVPKASHSQGSSERLLGILKQALYFSCPWIFDDDRKSFIWKTEFTCSDFSAILADLQTRLNSRPMFIDGEFYLSRSTLLAFRSTQADEPSEKCRPKVIFKQLTEFISLRTRSGIHSER